MSAGWKYRWLLLLLCAAGTASAQPYQDAEAAYRDGRYAKAEVGFEAALARSEGLPVSVPYAKARLGLALRKQGKLTSAARWLEEAISEAVAAGDLQTASVAQRYLGRVHFNRGEFDEALARYELAKDHHAAHGPPRDLLADNLEIAALHYRQDRLGEAYDTYVDALQVAVELPDPGREAVSLIGLGLILHRRGDYGSAGQLMADAEAIYAALGRSHDVAATRVHRSVVMLWAGDRVGGRALAEWALPRVRGHVSLERAAQCVIARAWLLDGEPARAIDVLRPALEPDAATTSKSVLAPLNFLLAQAYLALGELDSAEAAIDAAAAGVDTPNYRAWSAQLRGRLAQARGESERAILSFETYVRSVEQEREGAAPDELVMFYREHEQIGPYEALLGLYVDAGRLSDAIGLVSQLKARALVEQLRTEQPPAAASAAQRTRGLQLSAARHDVVAHLVSPAWGDPRLAQRHLPPSLAVIDYYMLPDRLLVFWVTRDQIEVKAVPVEAKVMARHVERLVAEIGGAGTDYAPDADWLGRHLLEPIADRLQSSGARYLCVIPHAGLHALPFAMLPVGGKPLVERWPVFSAPSFAALATVLERDVPGATPRRWLAVGDARGELAGARSNALALGGDGALVGRTATEEAVRLRLAAADRVHLAVHGVRGGKGSAAYLDFNAAGRHDGRLYAFEIAGLSLSADLVALPACDTAVGTPQWGDEIPDVLDRAFLAAGARSVLATLWATSDRGDEAFMRRFYEELRHHGRLEALARTQRAFLRANDARPAVAMVSQRLRRPCKMRGLIDCDDARRSAGMSHPYHWAAFRLIGDYR